MKDRRQAISAQPQREATKVDQLANEWLDFEVKLDPVLGTRLGRQDADERFGDYSPRGAAARRNAASEMLAKLRYAQTSDFIDEVTVRDLSERLESLLRASDARLELRDLTVLESPTQFIRQAFDLMPKGSIEAWAVIARRLARVPEALAGYRETLTVGIRVGITPARRQVLAVARQANRFSHGYFSALVAEGERFLALRNAVSQFLLRDLVAAAEQASKAYAEFARFLEHDLAERATRHDGVGRDHYAISTRNFLGTDIDPDEAYEWGLSELGRITREQQRAASEIVPGGTVAEAVALLDGDPSRVLQGSDALRGWVQERSDEAIDALNGHSFDIPSPLQRIECRIAPTRDSGIYYTAPSDDFSRPGRIWWTIPEGTETFRTWRELTTVYHEGVPGHHLQMGGAVARKGELNAWRRGLAGTSGHFEGWALYAERLMEELGFLEDPGNRLGLLDAQRMRAARVVLDIGVHLGKSLPDGSGTWNAASALDFMARNVTMRPAAVGFEVLRYLGWPGQAISYKVGERVWNELRDDAAHHAGSAFDLRGFHANALDLGSLGLDTLKWAMRPETERS